MDPGSVEKAAGALLDAYATGTPISPLTTDYPDMSIADAYAVQAVQVKTWTDAGARVKGHKVGLTSAAMQRQLGVNYPDSGVLLDSMFLPENDAIERARFLQPRVEPEVAFVLGRRLAGPGVTAADAVGAVEYVLPALEVIDSRIADWKIKLPDTIADNASSGGVVLGTRPVRLDGLDLALMGCLLHRNGNLIDTGAGGAVLGSPINALVWLANVLGESGQALEPGHVVLPGSITAMVPVAPGDTMTATFAGVGSVTARFAEEDA
ncbi:2-keto-4-pentenoate hydratase [Actinomadura sp. WAC 06369]|uniref:2-keto-4-pentenoate hydratase n=1 Tax=Actinomadura sp. WAC 06369 TaxID=2203193 RepID=UPI000F792607|nr:fumarylacetoacetate hydrolase family protein [Actinomadura sp. WAC 06369]RSN66942.1 2-keto-4-pentenoate hydratase [Actinomadura sp. WAC 06369]